MDELTRLELDTLISEAALVRASRPDEQPQGEDAPLALQGKRCDAMAKALARCADPTSPKDKVAVRRVHAVAEPDERGLIEVSYLDPSLEPMTAFMRGTELAYLVEGW